MWWRAWVHVLVVVLSCAPALWAQQRWIEGRVYGREPDGTERPLGGVRLRWAELEVGSFSLPDGRFRLLRPQGAALLQVRAVGYRQLDTLLPEGLADTVVLVLEAEYSLSEVTVEAPTPTIAPAPVKTELIGRRQLEQSACCTLAESFEKSPTVEASFSDPLVGARQIQLLGLSGVYVQTLTEAIPALRGLALPFQWEYVPGPFLESIAIAKGATSVVDGYEGLTGSIVLEYWKPQTAAPLFVNLFGNSVGRVEFNAVGALRGLGAGWSGMGFLHGWWAGSERDANRDGFRDMPLVRQLTAMTRMLHQGQTEVQLLATAVLDERDGGTLAGVAPERRYPVWTRGRRGEVLLKGSRWISPWTQVGIRAMLVGQGLEAQLGFRPYTGTQQTAAVKALFVTELPNEWRLRYGVDVLLERTEERFADTVWNRRELVPGAFLEATLTLEDQLTLVAGLRGDWHNLYGAFLTPRAYLRWQPTLDVTLRLSAGRGMRVPNPVADNMGFFLSSRQFVLGALSPEWGWNYGGSFTLVLPFAPWTFDAEFYRTEFRNQVVPDLDVSPRLLVVQNVGRAYANSALLQLEGRIAAVEVRVAYRWWDTWARTGGQWRRRPLVSPHRVLVTLSAATQQQRWQFDATMVWHSAGRLPTDAGNPDSLRWGERYPAFFRLNAQVTRRFNGWELYAGVENATNALQRRAVVDAANPHGPYFDASLIWGPLEARLFYLGLRWRLGAEG